MIKKLKKKKKKKEKQKKSSNTQNIKKLGYFLPFLKNVMHATIVPSSHKTSSFSLLSLT